jgi:hypothetical protein
MASNMCMAHIPSSWCWTTYVVQFYISHGSFFSTFFCFFVLLWIYIALIHEASNVKTLEYMKCHQNWIIIEKKKCKAFERTKLLQEENKKKFHIEEIIIVNAFPFIMIEDIYGSHRFMWIFECTYVKSQSPSWSVKLCLVRHPPNTLWYFYGVFANLSKHLNIE